MNFFRRLLPNTIPDHIDANDLTLVLRERILQQILLISSIMGTVFFIISTIPALKRSPFFILVVASASLLFLTLFTIRKVNYQLRSSIFINILIVMTVSALLIYGLEGSGILLAMASSILTFLLRGRKTGITMAFISTFAIAAAAILMVTGLIPPPSAEIQYDSTVPGGWLSVGLAFVVLSVILMAATTSFVAGLQNMASSQMDLSKELKEERDLLETRVAQRTQEAEKRAVQMEIAASVAHDISQETNIDRLLTNAVELLVQRFNLYYAAVFLVDDKREFAVLRSGSGMAGKAMLEQHHQLRVGQVGMVGYVVANNQFRLAQDVKSDPAHYENPFLPQTQSELALPLTVAGEVIGALDLQSVEKDAFSPTDIQVLSITADQLAVAIQRAQLVDQLQQSVEEMESGLRSYTQTKWSAYLRSSQKVHAYRFAQSRIEPISQRSDAAQKALALGRVVVTEASGGSHSPDANATAAVPIRLRNHILGVIEIKFNTTRAPAEMLTLLESASDRLGIALENARLLEEVQSRAVSERVVSEISSRVRSATTIDNVLKTAVAELGKSLGVAEVVVQLRSSD